MSVLRVVSQNADTICAERHGKLVNMYAWNTYIWNSEFCKFMHIVHIL